MLPDMPVCRSIRRSTWRVIPSLRRLRSHRVYPVSYTHLDVYKRQGPWHLVRSVSLPRHQLSHQRLHAVVHRIETPAFTPAAAAMAVPADSLGDYAVPRHGIVAQRVGRDGHSSGGRSECRRFDAVNDRMKPLVRQLVPGQGNAAHQMPRTLSLIHI